MKYAPWFVVEGDDKRRARLNCISHLLDQLPYSSHIRPKPTLSPRPERSTYVRPPYGEQTVVPRRY